MGGGGTGPVSECRGNAGGEAVDDTPFLQIVGRHLDLHPVTRENTDAMHPHATREMAVQLVVFGLLTGNSDPERGIGKAFLHNADEFNHVLGHRESCSGARADRSYRRI